VTDALALLTPEATPDAPPPVLLPYQQAWIADGAQLKVWEKSRRVGATWAEAADAVLIACKEGGTNYFYISATQDMAREFIEAVAMWAKAFSFAASAIGDGIYEDGVDPEKGRRFIKTYEVSFPGSGRRIVALSSRPTNLRGKQGTIGIDEAAFAPELAGLLKAAMAMLLWGDKVRIWSTHDGAENPFNGLIEEIRAGKRGSATVHRITFAEAVEQGLYSRVCLRKGIAWTASGQAKWVSEARAMYGDDAAEELDVIPSQSGGAYLSLALISQRMVPAWSATNPTGPVLVRGKWDDAFAYLPEDVRRYAIDGWIGEQLVPHLKRLNPLRRHTFGNDFARNRDQSIITILEQDTDLVERPVLTVELANCPFSSQQQILFALIDGVPRFRGGAMDATGNGAALAEAAAQRYGSQMIEQVKLNDGFYLAHMPKLKAGLQDATLIDLPRDELLRDDLRALKLINGVPKLPKADTQSAAAKAAAADGGAKSRRHGDFAIALFLAHYAFTREAGEIDFRSAPSAASTWSESAGDGTLRMRADTFSADAGAGFENFKGAW
jgi:phage FluMu gp28-like protein